MADYCNCKNLLRHDHGCYRSLFFPPPSQEPIPMDAAESAWERALSSLEFTDLDTTHDEFIYAFNAGRASANKAEQARAEENMPDPKADEELDRKAEALLKELSDCFEAEFAESGMDIDMPRALTILRRVLSARATEEAAGKAEHAKECAELIATVRGSIRIPENGALVCRWCGAGIHEAHGAQCHYVSMRDDAECAREALAKLAAMLGVK